MDLHAEVSFSMRLIRSWRIYGRIIFAILSSNTPSILFQLGCREDNYGFICAKKKKKCFMGDCIEYSEYALPWISKSFYLNTDTVPTEPLSPFTHNLKIMPDKSDTQTWALHIKRSRPNTIFVKGSTRGEQTEMVCRFIAIDGVT